MLDASESVVAATETALLAADDHLTTMDVGAVAALRRLAAKIDSDDAVREALLSMDEQRRKERPPQLDNVSIPTYLKYCEALGLSPLGRQKLGQKKESGGGKLAQLRSISSAG